MRRPPSRQRHASQKDTSPQAGKHGTFGPISGNFRGILGSFLCYDEPRCGLSGWRGRAVGSDCAQDIRVYAGLRGGKGVAMRYIFGDYVLDTERYELHHAGELIKLRRKVFQVFVYLLSHRDRVVPKQELLAHLWPDQFVGEETLTSCLKTLRKALGERGRTPRFLRTLHGQGYRFVGAVELWEHLPANDGPHALPRLRGEAATRQAEGPSPALSLPRADLRSPPWEALDEEHKQATVLCCALAEAPTLAAHLGPEAMHYLMRDVLALAQVTVQRYEGTLTQVSGEGFVALFGAPVAQEDHARQAVLAALEFRQRLHIPNAIRRQPHGAAVRLGCTPGRC
jgi:DNA-binding winged helix-turn-helix (wHTH) protein